MDWQEREQTKKIAVGDVVRLKSGSWNMCVARIRKGRALCVYKPFDHYEIRETWVPLTVLVNKF